MFMTASGKSSHVSAASLKKAAKLLGGQDINVNQDTITSSPRDMSTLFKTGRNSTIEYSESSIQNARAWLEGSSDVQGRACPADHEESVATSLHQVELASKISNVECGRSSHPISIRGEAAVFTNSLAQNLAKDKMEKRKGEEEGEEVTSIHRESNTPRFPRNDVPRKKHKRRFSVPMQKLEPSLHMPPTLRCPSPLTSPYVHINTQRRPEFKRIMLHSLFQEDEAQPRTSLKDYFEHRRCLNDRPRDEILNMTPDSAAQFKFLEPQGDVGPMEMRKKLLTAGADPKMASLSWVENHYRWIVWKLASYERRGGLTLAADRVLDQLKYRYEREVNRGSRSALQRITEKDAVPGREIVFCISAVRDIGYDPGDCTRDEVSSARSASPAKIEITDGWYWLPAYLDKSLSRLLRSGKLFVGQKLKVSGASLQGCEEGMPPLDATCVMSMKLEQNGTQRARWFDKLGFCRGPPQPLFFGCISDAGGHVPLTAVAILRTYPLLYREKSGSGGVTRTGRAEDVAARKYEERRAKVSEEVAGRFEGSIALGSRRKYKGEGARLAAALESSADPEGFFAELKEEQQRGIMRFREWDEECRRGAMEASLKEAVEAEGLGERDVSPLLRVRVGALLRLAWQDGREEGVGKGSVEGMITIWRPSEEQLEEVERGGMFLVSSLQPTVQRWGAPSPQNVLSFNTTRSTRWRRIPEQAGRKMSWHRQPRVATPIRDLPHLPLGSEFDMVGWVIQVGPPFRTGMKVTQWVFLADGGCSKVEGEEADMEILAVGFSAFVEGFVALEAVLSNTVVGWSSLVVKMRDERNELEVGEVTDAAQLFSSFGSRQAKHLGEAAEAIKTWIADNAEAGERLRHRVYDIMERNP